MKEEKRELLDVYETEEGLFISREMYELAKKEEIDIEGKPKIINDKNYYSVTKEQLNSIEACMNKEGIEIDINKKEEKGELNMNLQSENINNEEINIDNIKEELALIATQEEKIMELLEDNRQKMEKVNECIKLLNSQEESIFETPSSTEPITSIKNNVKILGDPNVDIEKIKEEIQNIIKKDAKEYAEKELKNIKIDVEQLKEELRNYLDAEEKNIVEILGDPNVDIEEAKRKINSLIEEKEPTNVVKILGDPNVDIKDIQRQLNELIEDKVDTNIVKILGDQNVNIEKIKEELNRILNADKEQNLVKVLGNPDIDIEEIDQDLNELIEKETNKNIVKNVSEYNVDLNAVREELLNKERLEPTKRMTVNTPENNKLLDLIRKQSMILNNKNLEDISINGLLEELIVYKDTLNNKKFAPKEYTDNQGERRIINGEEYAEISDDELENITDKQIVVKMITNEEVITPKTINVIVCNANDKLFVAQEILNTLGMYVVDPHKIIVNKEIYVEITKDDLEIIRSKEQPTLHINIEIKHITPIKG